MQVAKVKEPSDEKLASLRFALGNVRNGSDEYDELDEQLTQLLDDQQNKANIKLSYVSLEEVAVREPAERSRNSHKSMECEQFVLIGLIAVILITTFLLSCQIRKMMQKRELAENEKLICGKDNRANKPF